MNEVPLAQDVGESQDVAVKRPGVVDQLQRDFLQWQQDLKPPAFPPLGSWMKPKKRR